MRYGFLARLPIVINSALSLSSELKTEKLCLSDAVIRADLMDPASASKMAMPDFPAEMEGMCTRLVKKPEAQTGRQYVYPDASWLSASQNTS